MFGGIEGGEVGDGELAQSRCSPEGRGDASPDGGVEGNIWVEFDADVFELLGC